MPLPPLYKYLDVRGAVLTLEDRTFKHSKPSDFNDTQDLTVQNVFPEELEVALQTLERNFTDVILEHLHEPPTCDEPMRTTVALLQQTYRNNAGAADRVRAELARDGAAPIFDVEHMRAQSQAFVQEINEFLQLYRVLCVTTRIDSERMWGEYAQQHQGIALRIEPNVAKDSKFQLFRPVVYRDERPALYERTLDFTVNSLFGDRERLHREMSERIIYSKTRNWEHESEYRLAIPMRAGEEPWNVLRFNPEEITEIYLGVAMHKTIRASAINMARSLNPAIKVYQADRHVDAVVQFKQIHP